MKNPFSRLFNQSKNDDSLIAHFSKITITLSVIALFFISILWLTFHIINIRNDYKKISEDLIKKQDYEIKEKTHILKKTILAFRNDTKINETTDSILVNHLAKLIRLVSLNEKKHFFICTEKGKLIFLNQECFFFSSKDTYYCSKENFKQIKKALADSTNNYIDINWQSPLNNISLEKKFYIQNINTPDWIIGFAYDKNQIKKVISDKKKELFHSIMSYMAIFLLVVGITIIFALFYSKTVYKQLQSDLKFIFSFFRQGIDNSEEIDTELIDYKELRSLAVSFNSIIDKKIRAERQLHLEQAYLNEIFEKSPEGIIIADEDSNVLRANPGFLDMFGYPAEKVLGKPIDQLIASEGFYGEASWYTNEILKGKKVELETLRKHSSGKLVNVSILGSLIDLGKDEKAIFGVYRDITERKIAEEDLKESEEKWRSLYGNLPGASYSLNKDNVIEEVNQMLCDLTGFKSFELIGKHCSVICPEKTAGEDILTDSITSIVNYETYIKRKDGSLMPVLKSSQKFSYENKILIVENFLDITKLKEAEANLNQAKIKAEESDHLKSAFLANMSHEIRTPMNAIIGFTELLKDANFTEKEKNEFLDIIKSNGKALLMLIDDIIDISQIEAGQLKIHKLDCEINEIINDVVLTFSERAKAMEKGHLKITINRPAEFSKLIINTDPYRFRQIITNLVGNSLKFTEEGCIEVGYYKRDNNNLEFFVKDTGIGIPDSKQKLIFSRFRQVDESKTKKVRGNGLGLAITSSLVELLGGDIRLQSKENHGTTFFFTLPYKYSEIIKTKEDETINISNTINWEGLKILIAEDSRVNFVFLQKALKRTKASIFWAKNGQEAVDFINEHPDTNIILMDIQMPIMNGYEATVKIKKINPEIPVIAQTAYAMAGEQDIAFSSGCDDYIPKPIIIDNLLSKINNLVFNKN